MNRIIVTIFFCVAAATLTFAQDASPAPESTTTGPSATTANATESASGSALNGSTSGLPSDNGSTAPPTGTPDQNSTTATGGSSDQGALNVTSGGSADQQKGSSTSASSGQSDITTESSSSTTASPREESTTENTTESTTENTTENTTESTAESTITESGSQSSSQSSIGSSSDTTETSNSAISSQTRNREGDQQTQGSSNQVGAQSRALDNNGAGATSSSQRSTTPRRNNVASAPADNRITSSLTSNANVVPGNFGPIQTNAQWTPITEMNVQAPSVWEALGQLRGYNKGRNVQDPLNSVQAYDLISTAQAGSDYPDFSTIPTTGFSCEQVGQPGFYADTEARCQVIRRCDINAIETSYLCPNMTVFNQITLICDWFFNVDCAQSRNFYDYSNRRLYHGADWVLLSDEVLLSGQTRAANAATTRDPLLEI